MKHKDTLVEALRSGMSDLLILNLLKEKDYYGFELIKVLRVRTHNVFSFESSSIYLPLQRMEERGLISSYSEIVKEKRFRRYYHIEKEGHDYLERGRKCGAAICTEFLNNMKIEVEKDAATTGN